MLATYTWSAGEDEVFQADAASPSEAEAKLLRWLDDPEMSLARAELTLTDITPY